MSLKEQVLDSLLDSETEVSGEALAASLGVSRSAVWKAINQLRDEGYGIEAGTNRGYRLTDPDDIVTPRAIERWLTTKTLGRKIEVHRDIESTNTRCKELAAQGAPEGTLVVALAQSAGRGRMGRRFFSPDGMGIYFTVLLRPKLSADRAVMVTSMSAVAVCRALERIADVKAQIKWVNDIYIGGLKVCGILHEAGMDFESGQLEYAAAGIGINCEPVEFPEELRGIATSVGNVCGHRISRARVAAEVMNCMEELYDELGSASFMAESRARSCVLGKAVTVIRGDDRYDARAIDIDDEGGLVVELADGTRKTVQSGEISVRVKKD